MYKGKTQQQWNDEINAWQFRDVYLEVLATLYPNSQFEDNSAGEVGEDLYNQVNPFQMVGGEKVYDTKLDYMTDVLDALEAYKEQELLRVDLAFRAMALTYWIEAAQNLGLLTEFTNKSLFVDHIYDNLLEDEMLALEMENATLSANIQFEEGVQERIKRISLGNRIIGIISKMNEDNAITVSQSNTIFSDPGVQSLIGMLQTGALETAQALLNSLDLTALPPIDESYRTKVNAEINSYLGV